MPNWCSNKLMRLTTENEPAGISLDFSDTSPRHDYLCVDGQLVSRYSEEYMFIHPMEDGDYESGFNVQVDSIHHKTGNNSVDICLSLRQAEAIAHFLLDRIDEVKENEDA